MQQPRPRPPHRAHPSGLRRPRPHPHPSYPSQQTQRIRRVLKPPTRFIDRINRFETPKRKAGFAVRSGRICDWVQAGLGSGRGHGRLSSRACRGISALMQPASRCREVEMFRLRRGAPPLNMTRACTQSQMRPAQGSKFTVQPSWRPDRPPHPTFHHSEPPRLLKPRYLELFPTRGTKSRVNSILETVIEKHRGAGHLALESLGVDSERGFSCDKLGTR